MCGIVGIFGGDIRFIENASLAIKHRGPDDHGIYTNNSHKIGLAHRRLSIIDTSDFGHQPMVSDDGKVVLIFNGEIYNFKEISNDLIKQPITFIGAISALIVMAFQREGMAFVLLCLVVIPVCVFPIRRVGELLLNKALNMQEKAGGLTSVLSENLSAYKEVRAYNLEKREMNRFSEFSIKNANPSQRNASF